MDEKPQSAAGQGEAPQMGAGSWWSPRGALGVPRAVGAVLPPSPAWASVSTAALLWAT